MSYTKELYSKTKNDLTKELGCKNVMETPRLEKIVLNMGFKAADADNNFLKYVVDQLSLIAGQKAVLTKAKKSIAGFKLREESPIGCKVTLRGNKMYEFMDRLVYIAMPRIRDFRGLPSKNFNQSGHYTFGIKEHSIFPEIDLDKAYKALGMNITIVATAKNKEGCKALLKKLNFPIK
jgi:large subunit ribosomal protein L5